MSDIHILPVADLVDHDEVRTCWCGPRLAAPCPEGCEDGCWRCVGGLVDTDTVHDGEILVIHNAMDGRD